jgi:hypothetical protein
MDIWLMDLYQNADEITKGLFSKSKYVRIFGHSFVSV